MQAYQKRIQHVKAEEVDDRNAGAAGVLLSGTIVWFGVTEFSIHTGHHDFMPSLSSGDPVKPNIDH